MNRELASRYAPGNEAGADETGGGRVVFMDLAALFLRDGQVDRTQFLDDHLVPPDPPLHPTAQAQARIAEAIEPIVAAAMGDRAKVHS